MEQQFQQIAAWLHVGQAFTAVDTRTLVAFSFAGLNGLRIFLANAAMFAATVCIACINSEG